MINTRLLQYIRSLIPHSEDQANLLAGCFSYRSLQKGEALVMDMQAPVLAQLADPAILLNNVSGAIEHARWNNIPAIYIVVGFRKNAPEASSQNKMFGGNKTRYANANAAEMLKVHPALAPAEDEATVVKRRVSAFTGSDLELVFKVAGNPAYYINRHGSQRRGIIYPPGSS